MKEKLFLWVWYFIILEIDNLKRMDDSVLFQLPPELLCGLLSKLPGEDLKQFGNSFHCLLGIRSVSGLRPTPSADPWSSVKLWIRSTCRRLKEIADQTAIGKIAYLLRKRDPMWARLHKGAVRQGLRSASAILAWMETNLQRAKTKTRLPTVVKLDTGNNFHSLDGIDDLKKVNLFDEKKIELDFKIEDNIAAAAFFTRYS